MFPVALLAYYLGVGVVCASGCHQLRQEDLSQFDFKLKAYFLKFE